MTTFLIYVAMALGCAAIGATVFRLRRRPVQIPADFPDVLLSPSYAGIQVDLRRLSAHVNAALNRYGPCAMARATYTRLYLDALLSVAARNLDEGEMRKLCALLDKAFSGMPARSSGDEAQRDDPKSANAAGVASLDRLVLYSNPGLGKSWLFDRAWRARTGRGRVAKPWKVLPPVFSKQTS